MELWNTNEQRYVMGERIGERNVRENPGELFFTSQKLHSRQLRCRRQVMCFKYGNMFKHQKDGDIVYPLSLGPKM